MPMPAHSLLCIRDKLATTIEGISHDKESKIVLLIFDYEFFKMKLGESTDEMPSKFIDIINELKALKKTYSNKEMVKKLLNNLPKE
ncbi:UBN2 domain-containing protein [Gossypium australe]|uniref:UBN2 domain-containing protein n=1 Tax=Gossypium australe TaxID=47621 RepID=A0A5B6VDZ4_9ROSI|nr:UBN2 domain-containing protein [Gossypium australe]